MKFLKEGDVIEISGEHQVYASVPRHFLYSDCLGDFTMEKALVSVAVMYWLAGRYIVVKTTVDGGGTGHGPGDVYPDGHHVFCENEKFKIEFYQSGSFRGMITDIKPVGRAKRTWSIE